MIIISKKLDFHLIKFPIILPLIYFLILYVFPEYERELILFSILLLAEPHFGATWPFFINKVNFKYISENKYSLIYAPIFLFIICLFSFIYATKLFLLIFFAANVYHVTRQSVGVCKLYTKNKEELSYQEIGIYFFNLLFFLFGFLKFYLNIFVNQNENLILAITLIVFLSYSIIYIKKYSVSENLFTTISGIIIFFPICFVSNPVHAIIMGVTIHYSQYLALTYKISYRRQSKIKDFFLNYKFILTIAFYSIIMTLLSLTKSSF